MSRPPVSMVPVFALPVPPAAGFRPRAAIVARVIISGGKHTACRRRHLAFKAAWRSLVPTGPAPAGDVSKSSRLSVSSGSSVTVTSSPRTAARHARHILAEWGLDAARRGRVDQIDNLRHGVRPHIPDVQHVLPLVTDLPTGLALVVGNGGWRRTRAGVTTKTSSS